MREPEPKEHRTFDAERDAPPKGQLLPFPTRPPRGDELLAHFGPRAVRATLYELAVAAGLSAEEALRCARALEADGLLALQLRPDGNDRRRLLELTPAGRRRRRALLAEAALAAEDELGEAPA